MRRGWRERDASREHTLTESMALLTAAGVWLKECCAPLCRCRVDLSGLQVPTVSWHWLAQAQAHWFRECLEGNLKLVGETQEVTEGHSHPSKRSSASLRLNDSVIWYLKCMSLGKPGSQYIFLFTSN